LCNNNQITLLPDLPQCNFINCEKNQITSLPDLTNCIYFDCSNNNIDYLPELPNCEDLRCKNNNLTSLPNLSQCNNLDCSKNQIKFLPFLPKCNQLIANDNKLFYLPDIHCKIINLQSNDFNHIAELNYNVKEINLSNNPLKDYNLKQLKEKYSHVKIEYDKELKVETIFGNRKKFYTDLIIH